MVAYDYGTTLQDQNILNRFIKNFKYLHCRFIDKSAKIGCDYVKIGLAR